MICNSAHSKICFFFCICMSSSSLLICTPLLRNCSPGFCARGTLRHLCTGTTGGNSELIKLCHTCFLHHFLHTLAHFILNSNHLGVTILIVVPQKVHALAPTNLPTIYIDCTLQSGLKRFHESFTCSDLRY